MSEFDQLCREIQKRPQTLTDVVQFIHYLASPSCQRLAQGKKQEEFAQVLLFVLSDREKKLSSSAIQFMAHSIFPYLVHQETQLLLRKTDGMSPSDVAGGLKILKEIVERSPRSSSSKKKFFFPWFQGKEKGYASKNAEGDFETVATSSPVKGGREVEDDETISSSSSEKPSSGRYRKSPSGRYKKELAPPPMEDTTFMSSGKGAQERKLLEVFNEETFCSASPVKVSPIRRLTLRLSGLRSQTILSTTSPLVDHELETLRVQTLVSIKKPAPTIKWISFPKEEDVYKVRPQDLPRMLVGLASQPTLSKEAKQMLEQFKSALAIRSKLLTEAQITLNIVNQGVRSFHHTLDRLSSLSDSRKVNKKVWEYLLHCAEQKLSEHADGFRKRLESCLNNEEMYALLSEYKLESSSIFKKYSILKIVQSVKMVLAAYERQPDRLTRILNKYLGVHGETNIKNKLSQLLLTSDSDANIVKKISKERSLEGVLKALRPISSRPEFYPGAGKLIDILQSFEDPQSRSGFTQFKAGVNIFSPALSGKLLSIARQSLQGEIKREVSSILSSKRDAVERMAELKKILTHPRYHDSLILLYGHTVDVLYEKINSINPRISDLEKVVKHVFSGTQVPKELIALIAESKKGGVKSSQKTLENCVRVLSGIEERIANREPIQLRIELISLFKSYGQVEFSHQSAPAVVNGYDMAQIITDFYNVANRTTIVFPEYVVADIRVPLKRMIDEERSKQLKKMGMS